MSVSLLASRLAEGGSRGCLNEVDSKFALDLTIASHSGSCASSKGPVLSGKSTTCQTISQPNHQPGRPAVPYLHEIAVWKALVQRKETGHLSVVMVDNGSKLDMQMRR